ncbi:MAG: hypothetical protein ACRCUT_12620, partial [Spirochaetota bacterium]
KKVTGIIQTYSRKAREQIVLVGTDFFKEVGIDQYIEDVFPCVDELIKNAVKANYKFALILEEMAEKVRNENPSFSDEAVRRKINDIVKNKELYDSVAIELTANEKISRSVRQILNEESQLIRMKNKAFADKRDYTEEEKAKIESLSNLQRIRNELERRNIRVRITIEMDDSFIYIEITNNAPIMEKDLGRIYEKREEFKICRDEQREQEFFMNNLDTSESGFGLGYATIDSFLGNMGLDPFRSIQIIAASNTTVILSLPIEELVSRK